MLSINTTPVKVRERKSARDMKKLCNGKGRRVHPSPPSSSPWDFLAALPAAVLTLAAALSSEEKEVLVYLLSGGDTGFFDADRALGSKKPQQPPHNPQRSHMPEIGCGCFGCYKSFWARWNASPNHHLIHHILDAVEESLESQSPPSARRRRRRSRRKDSPNSTSATVAAEVGNPADRDAQGEGYDDDDVGEEEDDEFDRNEEVPGGDRRSSVSRLVSFIGDRVWGAWNY